MGTFKQYLLNISGNRGDTWGNDVAFRFPRVSDLLAVSAQHYVRCYNKCRKPIAKKYNSVPLMSDQALSRVVDEMCWNWGQTRTVSELWLGVIT